MKTIATILCLCLIGISLYLFLEAYKIKKNTKFKLNSKTQIERNNNLFMICIAFAVFYVIVAIIELCILCGIH